MNEQSDFRERVQALVAEGKLTAEEAEQLLSGEVRVTGETPQGKVPRRMTVKLTGTNVQVYHDASVSTPQVSTQGEGRVELRSTPDGWLLRRDDQQEGWLKGLMGGWMAGGLKVDLRLPPDFLDLDIDLMGGNLRLHDLGARVRAKLAGGNLTLGQVSALNVNVTGGNVNATCHLGSGEHSLKVTGGNANLTVFDPDRVHLSAHVIGGNLRTPGFSVRRRDTSPASAHFESDGANDITLSLNLTGGNATVTGEGVTSA